MAEVNVAVGYTTRAILVTGRRLITRETAHVTLLQVSSIAGSCDQLSQQQQQQHETFTSS